MNRVPREVALLISRVAPVPLPHVVICAVLPLMHALITHATRRRRVPSGVTLHPCAEAEFELGPRSSSGTSMLT
jgi:hypothetical protein